ncbi:hypothetical protein BHE74_00026376 [Ensete ventricosum]|nr:hypothetical protein BHE74_00026376 [Ensete ventricosum]
MGGCCGGIYVDVALLCFLFLLRRCSTSASTPEEEEEAGELERCNADVDASLASSSSFGVDTDAKRHWRRKRKQNGVTLTQVRLLFLLRHRITLPHPPEYAEANRAIDALHRSLAFPVLVDYDLADRCLIKPVRRGSIQSFV